VTTGTARLIVLAAALAACGAADSRRTAFGVGVLRRDGIIVPFAAFDGRRWSSPWPIQDRELLVPINVASVPHRWWGPTPPLETWQATTAKGAAAVRVVQPDWVDTLCARQVGLRTDYRSQRPPPPPTVQPYPKDGLAVSPPVPVDRIENVALDSAEARTILPAVHESFNAAETRTESRWGHPIQRRAREGLLPTLEAIYAYGSSPRYLYVEASRSYRELGQPIGECAAVANGTGWFVSDASGPRELTMVVDVLNCGRASASYMLPLGVLQLNGRVYWLAQFSGWDHERYVVLELKKKSVDVVINTWESGC
jgi:hypothetical protein